MMPGKIDKGIKAEQDSGDEMQPERQNMFPCTSSRTVNFATTTQAISFDKDQQPNSIVETQPTQFPTALGFPARGQSPPPEAAKQPDQMSFTTEQADEMSNTATTALQTSETSENQQLKHDLALARKELDDIENENLTLQWKNQQFYDQSLHNVRKVMETKKESSHATCNLRVALQRNGFLQTNLHDTSVELKAALQSTDVLKDRLRFAKEKANWVQNELLQSNDVLKDRLRAANEKADKLQNELATVRAEKSEMEKKTPVEQTPMEQTLVEQTPVEQTPVEQTPVEQTPVEQTPVEQTPVEQKVWRRSGSGKRMESFFRSG